MDPQKALGFMAMLLACLAVKAGCVAMSVWFDKAAPAFTARAVYAYRTRGRRSLFLGAANGIVLALLFAVLVGSHVKALAPVGMLVLLTTAAAAMTGYMIAYHDVGQRLRGDSNWPAVRTIVLGGITAEVAFMTPVIGQIFSIGVLFRGLGAVVSALLSRGATQSDASDKSDMSD